MTDLLLRIDDARLYKVVGLQQTLLRQGRLEVTYTAGTEFGNLTAQVEDYKWPLVAQTAMLHVSDVLYTIALPDVRDHYLCLELPQGLPGNVLEAAAGVFDSSTSYQEGADVQHGSHAHAQAQFLAVNQQAQQQLPALAQAQPSKTDHKVALMIERTGSSISHGIVKAGDYTAHVLSCAGEYALTKTKPGDKPVSVSLTTQQRLKTAASYAAGAASVTSAVAAKASEAVAYVASGVAHRVAPKAMADENSSTKQLLRAGVGAMLEVWDALEEAAVVVMKVGGHETSRFVNHKYGPEAAESARDVFKIGESVFISYAAVRRLTARGLLKATAKHTALQLSGQSSAPGAPPAPAVHPPAKLASAASAPQLHSPGPHATSAPPVPAQLAQAASFPAAYGAPAAAAASVPPAATWTPGLAQTSSAPPGAYGYQLPDGVTPVTMAAPMYPATRPPNAYPAPPR